MGKIKVYTVVCIFDFESGIEMISLERMVKNLYISETETKYGTNYNVEEVVKYCVDRKLRVKFDAIRRHALNEIDISYHTSATYDDAKRLANYLNEYRNNLYLQMSKEELDEYLLGYANNYIKQINGEVL